ncbi:MAG: phage portal protein [Dermatophilaceae bacterium]|jgi:hypothetical protein|nr:phage portal protein [Dermatophilaceae bacterium]
MLAHLQQRLRDAHQLDQLNLSYYLGTRRVPQLGMAIPPNARDFWTFLNWPRVLVNTKEQRQQVRALILPGEETADPQLRAIWDANNLDADLTLFNTDRMVFGRAFLSAGSNEDDPELPIIQVESPMEMSASVDVRRRRLRAAAKFHYEMTDSGRRGDMLATLYLPDQTIWCRRGQDGLWVEDAERDVHNLGAVPIVMHLNRRRTGVWTGESELTDIIPLVDAAGRTMTNMQFAVESHGIPRIIATAVSKGDFTDPKSGKLIPQWEQYFNAVWTLTNKDAKVFNLTPADLKNFETALNLYGRQAATLTGFPARYFGLFTSNPPAEGAIRADEANLVQDVERDNATTGTTIGWAMGLARRIVTGEWTSGNQIRVEWHDPATPTVAQREDALAKRRAAGALSREGYWDEIGWSEARKAKERAYFEAELGADPVLALGREMAASSGIRSGG